MKHLFSVLAIAALSSFALTSCEKGEDGVDGPQGPTGNANVTVYNYGSQTSSGGSLNYTLTISKEKMDSSLVLVYYNPSTEAATAWYPCPGLGSSATYDTRFFVYQTATTPQSTYALSVRLMNPGAGTTYSGTVTFTKLKVVIAPASQILTGGRMTNPPYDVNDYNSVKRYFNLKD